MKTVFIVLSVVTLVAIGYFLSTYTPDPVEVESVSSFAVSPVEHASFALDFGDLTILNDPVGDAAAYAGFGVPDLILISDVHGDHFNVDTLAAVIGASTTIIAPEVVFAELPAFLKDKTIVMANGDAHTVGAVMIEAIPMYNLPMEGEDYRHVKGQGNGYVLEANQERVYIAGDTEGIPEMLALEDIDFAFIPMNLPYTMDVTAAAEAVLAFAPAVVYPYHYRGTDGLADVQAFQEIVNQGNPAIEVRLLDWYTQ